MVIPLHNFPNNRPYSNVQPFTQRDGASYLMQVEGIIAWLRNDVVPHIDAEVGGLAENWVEQTTSLIENWERLSVDLAAQVNEVAEGVSDDATAAEAAKAAAEAARDLAAQFASDAQEVQDASVTTIVSDAESLLRAELDALYPDKGTVVADIATLEETINTGRLSETELFATIAEAVTLPVYMDAPYSPDSELLPVDANRLAIAGWGSSTMEQLGTYLTTAAAEMGAAYWPGGKGGEVIEHHAARMNAVPARLSFPDNLVPASGAVGVTSSNLPNDPDLRTYAGFVTGLDGARVNGTLGYVAGALTFTRTTAGGAAPVAPNITFVSEEGRLHRNDVTILNVGKNSLTASDATGDRVIDYSRRMFDWQAAQRKRVLVVGHFADRDLPVDSGERTQLLRVNEAWRTRYGALYLDVYDWITSAQVWFDTGITPTPDDLAAQANGNKPPSLSSDNQHLSAAGRQALARRIQQRMRDLGWYAQADPVALTSDSFDRANTSAGVVGPSDIAHGGTPVTPTVEASVGIVSNALGIASTASTWRKVLWNVAQSDHRLVVKLTKAQPSSRYYVRHLDGDNNYYLTVTASALVLRARTGGNVADLFTANVAANDGDELELYARGSFIGAKLNGADVIPPMVSSHVPEGSEVGVACAAGTTGEWALDDLRVYDR